MGTYAETVIFDYCLSFADQGEQTSIFRLRFQQTNGSLPFLYIYAAVSIYMYIWKTDCINIYAALSNRKRKTEARLLSLISLLFALRANRSLLFVCLLTKKQTEVIRL
jgi:hypothetical protein